MQLWTAVDKDNNGFITGAEAVPFFDKSGLSRQILGQIWLLADPENKGVLGQQGFSVALKLIAHAQTGKTPSVALINTDAPLPRLEGLTPANTGEPPAAVTGTIAAQTTGSSEPPLTNEDKNKYGGMFISCGPVNGLLDADKAREVFLKSKLPLEKLGQIWNLADTKQRGAMDISDFTIAMYYIQHTMDGSITTLPATLPPSILKACTGTGAAGAGAGLLASSPVISAQTLTRQTTGNNINLHSNPAVARQLTGSLSMASSPLAQQNTGGASVNLFGTPSTDVPWEITAEEKAKFDRFFDQLDANGDGVVEGEEAGRFFMNSRLPEAVLAQIWDLADITGSGNLSKDEFAVAMLLINRKNATNAPIPKTLPMSLVPPSLRHRVAGSTSSLAFSTQEPLRSVSMPPTSQQFKRQSFDLLGDGPTLISSINTTGMTQQADKDLIGAEDLTSKLTSETGELASIQNQINNLSNNTSDLQAKRAILEKQLSVLAAQKQDMSIRLNQVKTLHESEAKSIRELESTLSSMQPQLIKLREELAVSERELLTARSGKDEFFLSVARDQEESNQIRTRLRMNNEEMVKLREELEAKKKETARQKGLLEIARRQLSTSDADKQKLLNEVIQESEKAAQAAREIQTQASGLANASTSSSSGTPPPPPAPRGSRKEPPPPPASRGSGAAASPSPSSLTARVAVSPEAEEAFGIPPALRSPTGSFHSGHSARMPAPPTVISRQSTGSSPFDTIPRQATGSSSFEPIPRQGTGMSANAPSITSVGGDKNSSFNNTFLTTSANGEGAPQDDLWSPSTHAANAILTGQLELTTSPAPQTPQVQQESLMTAAVGPDQATSPSAPVSGLSSDPFGSMAFPAMDTPQVTKMDFDSAFQGFSTSKSSSSNNNGVKSAEAFAEAFPDLDDVAATGADDTAASKRISAFGFEDDFSATGASPFTQTLGSSREDDEFPPIVELNHPDEDSSDDEDDDAFVQAKSSVTSPDPSVAAAPVIAAPTTETSTASAPVEDNASETAQAPPADTIADTTATGDIPANVAPPLSTGSMTKKLTAADFSEFETSFGGSSAFGGDDFDSAFKGVELAAPKMSSGAGTGGNMAGFDDGFDFNSSFDDAFGSSASPFGNTTATAQAPTSSTTNAFGATFSTPFPGSTVRQESFGDMEFNTTSGAGGAGAGPVRQATALDLDEAFGGISVSTPAVGATTATGTAPGSSDNVFGSGFGDFEAEFSSLSRPTSATSGTPSAAATAITTPRPVPGIPTSSPATDATAATPATATTTPAPPQHDMAGVDELIGMGFTREQANDALSRYDTVERAANFLIEGGQ
ncbi:hypothetical protein BGZ50_007648 [Haplosporangium sp. Z 11]|nr:hypothetical protein BGZ50_007648 [Haplosporangium sp. Z 11]